MVTQYRSVILTRVMSQSGLKGSKVVLSDKYNMFFTICDHYGPMSTFVDHFRQNFIFLLQSTLV